MLKPVNPWVAPPLKKTLVVGVADMLASNDARAELATHSLGSCLGLAIYDPIQRVGGLLHVMLPDSRIDPAKAASSPYMFVDTGVPRLFHAVYAFGGDKGRLIVRVAGGAQFLDQSNLFNIGERNTEHLFALLARNGVSVHAHDVGGRSSRTLRLDMSTGGLSIYTPGKPPYNL